MLTFLKLLILTNQPSWSAASFFFFLEFLAWVAPQQHTVDTDDVHFPNNTVRNGVSPGLYPSISGLYGKHELASVPPATPQPC